MEATVPVLDNIRGMGTIPVYHPTKACAAEVLGIGRTLAWEMAQRGDLPTIKCGRLVRVPVPALLAMLGEKA